MQATLLSVSAKNINLKVSPSKSSCMTLRGNADQNSYHLATMIDDVVIEEICSSKFLGMLVNNDVD